MSESKNTSELMHGSKYRESKLCIFDHTQTVWLKINALAVHSRLASDFNWRASCRT